MIRPEISGVNPMRLREVERRIGVLESFIAIEHPTQADKEAHALRLGIGARQFEVLLAAWRREGRGGSLPTSGASRGKTRAGGPRRLPKESLEVAHRVLEALGSDETLAKAAQEVWAACGRARTPKPSRSTIFNLMMKVRNDVGGRGPDAPASTGTVVARCHLRMPVLDDGALVMPEIALAVARSNGAVLAAELSPGPESAMLDLIDRPEPPFERLVVADDMTDNGSERPGCAIAVQTVPSRTARRMLARAIGRGLGDVGLIYDIGRAMPPERLLTTRFDQPLSWEQAAEVLRDRLARHNAERGAPPPKWHAS